MNFKNILFIDIETVPISKDYEKLDEVLQKNWSKKLDFIRKNKDISNEEGWTLYGGIYSEFSKIVCISTGFIHKNQSSDDYSFRIKSFYGDEEKDILLDFKDLLDSHYNSYECYLCAHNGKEFDYPFIGRRMIINNVQLPNILNLQGKKPWEVTLFDTMEMWKFGDYKSYISLELLSNILDIPSLKDDMDGSDVYEYYYNNKDLKSIVKYCEKDVLTTAKVFLKLRGFYDCRINKIEST